MARHQPGARLLSETMVMVRLPTHICITGPQLVNHAGYKKDLNPAFHFLLLSGEPDYFGRNKISSGGDLSHYSSASLY